MGGQKCSVCMWTRLSVCLGEVLADGRLKMQCLYVAGTRLSVCLGEVLADGRLKMQCLYVSGTTTFCPRDAVSGGLPVQEGPSLRSLIPRLYRKRILTVFCFALVF